MIQTGGVTEMLIRWRDGDETAGEVVLAAVYDELRRLAGRYLRRESPDHTLQPTALVHEAYLRLVNGRDPGFENRAHLIGIAARLMRQVLVNHARTRKALRRGGDKRRVMLEPALALFQDRCPDLVALDDALQRLADFDERTARVVELRFFGGMSVPEVATALGISARSVERDWSVARAWLQREVGA